MTVYIATVPPALLAGSVETTLQSAGHSLAIVKPLIQANARFSPNIERRRVIVGKPALSTGGDS